MSIEITLLHHINVSVPRAAEAASKDFYATVLGLAEIPKPGASRGRGGAWYQLGALQLHLSVEDGVENRASKRHICYVVGDLALAEQRFKDAGVIVVPDDQPTPGWPRFYVHDPGGNRIEIAQDLTSGQ